MMPDGTAALHQRTAYEHVRWHCYRHCLCSMRALYGTDGTRNACHGSDSPASAEREIKFYFPKLQLATAATDAEAAKVSYIRAAMGSSQQNTYSLTTAGVTVVGSLLNSYLPWSARRR